MPHELQLQHCSVDHPGEVPLLYSSDKSLHLAQCGNGTPVILASMCAAFAQLCLLQETKAVVSDVCYKYRGSLSMQQRHHQQCVAALPMHMHGTALAPQQLALAIHV